MAAVEISPGYPVAMRRRGKMRAVSFKPGELFIVVSVDVENGYGARELRGRVHQWTGYGDNAADVVGMTRCKELNHS